VKTLRPYAVTLLDLSTKSRVLQGNKPAQLFSNTKHTKCSFECINLEAFRGDIIQPYLGQDSRVKVLKFSDVSGTDSVPIFRLPLMTATDNRSLKRRRTFTPWRGCLSEKILLNNWCDFNTTEFQCDKTVRFQGLKQPSIISVMILVWEARRTNGLTTLKRKKAHNLAYIKEKYQILDEETEGERKRR
jgi:hypothetical protein